jgi:hypothetical protein
MAELIGEVNAVTRDGDPNGSLTPQDFKNNQTGDLPINKELALVCRSAELAKAFIQNRQWTLLWRDADILFQSPRPMTVYENTYVLEPNVQRFTVAKVCNAVVPQLYKGLFYDDPPMLLRPRPGTSQKVVDAKTSLYSYILDECKFKNHVKWGLEQMAHLGTGIFKWGYDWKEIVTVKRTAATARVSTPNPDGSIGYEDVPQDVPPNIERKVKIVPMPFFEHRPLNRVLVDPQLEVSDIREARWVIDIRYMDWYQFTDLKNSVKGAVADGENGVVIDGWNFPSDAQISAMWNGQPGQQLQDLDMTTQVRGVVFHSEEVNAQTSPDPRRTKLEVMEYWDNGRKILVLNKEKVIYTGDNEFKKIPFLSSNWWNRSRAFYGMGLGLIVGQNQRVDQGMINSILKILSYGVNPIYLRNRDDNAPTQTIRTGLGKILSVTDTEKSYKLLESPKVPGDVWSALKESESATESSSGADQTLVQGSSAGPRAGMGRSATGANLMAGASATRLDGPLDNFIEQVFKPFIGIIDMLVFTVMSDFSIRHILGKKEGADFLQNFSMQEFHDAQIEYEVLAGASLAAKRTMAQSMVMLTQILDNPQIQSMLAEAGKKINMEPIIDMWMEASEWKNKNDIVTDMTPDEIKRRDANSKAALQQQAMQAKQQSDQQKFQQKQQLEDQASDNRIKRDITREAARASGMSEAVNGTPSTQGLEGMQPTVE